MRRRRRTQVNPMRPLILLAVVWITGSLLFAAEDSPRSATDDRAREPDPVAVLAAAPAPQEGEGADQGATQTATQGANQAAQSESAKSTTPSEAPDVSKDETEDEVSTAASKQPADGAKSADAKPGATPQRFVPSEQVRADFDVSFPIDI